MPRTLAAVVLAAVSACSGNGASDHAAAGTAADTLRGTIALVGPVPTSRVVLVPTMEDTQVPLTGEAADPLASLPGVEVVVEGKRRVGEFEVRRFAVRAVDGVPAVDGALIVEGGTYWLVGESGERRRVAVVPEPLRAHVGRRVWIAGPLDAEPVMWGVIEAEVSPPGARRGALPRPEGR